MGHRANALELKEAVEFIYRESQSDEQKWLATVVNLDKVPLKVKRFLLSGIVTQSGPADEYTAKCLLAHRYLRVVWKNTTQKGESSGHVLA